MSLELRDLVWMAAVIDLRGRITSDRTHTRATPRIRLAVSGQQGTVIQRLCDLTGVVIEVTKSRDIVTADRRGCAEHCPEAHVHIESKIPSMFAWTVTGTAVGIILTNLSPYLMEDRGYDLTAKEALEHIPEPEARGGAAIVRSVYRLAGLGWEIPNELADYLEAAQRLGVLRRAADGTP